MLIPSANLKTIKVPLIEAPDRSDYKQGNEGDLAFEFASRVHEKAKNVRLEIKLLAWDVWCEERIKLDRVFDVKEGEPERSTQKRAAEAIDTIKASGMIVEVFGLRDETGRALSWKTDQETILLGLLRLGMVPDLVTTLKRSQEPGLLDTFRAPDLGMVGTGHE